MLDSSSLCSPLQEPDTDLEVVLEKKGNMDEAHIDQVPAMSSFPSLRVATPLLPGLKIPVSEAPWTPEATRPASVPHLQWQGTVAFPTSCWETPSLPWCWLRGHLVIQNPRLRFSSP